MNSLDLVLELLDDKIVKTNEGLFIRKEDLDTLKAQLKEMEDEGKKEAQPQPRTMSEARERIKKDSEWMKRWEERLRQTPPPEADLDKNVAESEA